MKLLVINPGSTSTKIAVYENEVITHPDNLPSGFPDMSVCLSDHNTIYSFRLLL